MSEQEVINPELMITDEKHHAFSEALAKTIIEHGQNLRPVELIAIMSHSLGGLVSLLPEDMVDNGAALDLIQRNLDKGNQDTNELLEPLKLLVSNDEPETVQ